MRNAGGLAVAGLLAACAAEDNSRVSPETIEAAAEQAQKQASEPGR
ncbi:MAG TPA: hypothetical protein VE891_00705 [Allosphingosinicella sp.]|nr:hypothetical protein [Allosphingosinicella sp.]